jgi:hypothetical protein
VEKTEPMEKNDLPPEETMGALKDIAWYVEQQF